MPTQKLRWGILSTAAIGTRKVIPAMQQSLLTSVDAIASRDRARAVAIATRLGIPRAYGSYEELLADPAIDAIYNPLPNDLHVPWTVRAAEAGKHVLCEKPIALSAAEARTLLAVRDRTGVLIAEAFMVDSHPQWPRLRELLAAGRIGQLRSVTGYFSYFNIDAANIRNLPASGGGALLDIGCYMVHGARYAFRAEPTRVVSSIDRDPIMGTDRLSSAIMEFPGADPGSTAHAIFTCSTQLSPHQRMTFIGTKGRIELQIPVGVPADRATTLTVQDGTDLFGSNADVETFPATDQYTLQGDAFARAVSAGAEAPVPLEDAIRNMAVLDALFLSAENGRWEQPAAAGA